MARGRNTGSSTWKSIRRQSGEAPSELERNIMLGTVLIVVFLLMLLGALPAWPHSRNWGYYPSGGFGLVLVILLILLVMGRI